MRNIFAINKKFFIDTLNKRNLLDQVYISSHFVNRYNERRLDPGEVHKLVNKFADHICEILYDFKSGNKPKVEHGNLVLQLSYNERKIIFMTVYDKTAKN